MIRALIEILKGSLCVFILLTIGQWMFGHFGFTLDALKDPATHSYNQILIAIAVCQFVIGLSLGNLFGYVWGSKKVKTKIIYSNDPRPEVTYRYHGYDYC